jgi:hypothetical protein
LKQSSETVLLLKRLPDTPRWLEVRDVLLGGEAAILGFVDGPEPSCVVTDGEGEAVFVIGRPARAAVRRAAQGLREGGSLIAVPEAAGWLAEALPGWRRDTIRLHTLPEAGTLPEEVPGLVRAVDRSSFKSYALPADLLGELESAGEYTEIVAAWVEGRPAAFCYAASETETLWDIAVDTLPEFRRRGYAGQVVAYMVRKMLVRGKRPVWAALESNRASWMLARKLGFARVDEMVMFVRGKGE